MIDKKTRIKLRSLAQFVKPTIWIGKDGFSENTISQINEELYNHELIKIATNDNAPGFEETDINNLAQSINADVVTTIGKKIVLYKVSDKKNMKHIL